MNRFYRPAAVPLAALLAALCACSLAEAPRAQTVPFVYVYGSADQLDRFGSMTRLIDGGETLLVGSDQDLAGSNRLVGSVKELRRDAQTGAWVESPSVMRPRLRPRVGIVGGDFGASIAVAVGDSLVAVGSVGEVIPRQPGEPDRESIGGMYVFRRAPDGAWSHEAFLQDPSAQEYSRGGTSVAASPHLVAMNIDGDRIRVYRDRGTAGADRWVADTTFAFSPSGQQLDGPNHLALSEAGGTERLAIGARRQGIVYLWRNDGTSEAPRWTREETLRGDFFGDAFGESVAFSADGALLAVGADAFVLPESEGRAYVYRREGDGATATWVREASLGVAEARAAIGGGVALSREPVTGRRLLAVGGPGRLYVFRRDEAGVWSEVALGRDIFFAETVTLGGATAASGNPTNGDRGSGAGRALVFDLRPALAVAGEDEAPAAEARIGVSPNPARSRASVSLTLAEASDVRVSVVDALGREVAVLHDGALGAGEHRLAVDVTRWAAGVYAVRVASGGRVTASRLAVVR